MSVDMSVSSSQSQAASVAAMCRQQKQGYEELQRSIDDFVMNSPQLEGAAYKSAKRFFSSVLMPLSKGGILLSEAVMEACQKFPEAYMTHVDSGDLKESELRKLIAQINRQMLDLSELQERLQHLLVKQQQTGALDGSVASRMSGNHQLMASYGQAKQLMEEKLAKLLAFNASSPTIFAEIAALEQVVAQGTSQAGQSWDSGSGTFTVPSAKSMAWATQIKASWKMREINQGLQTQGESQKQLEKLTGYQIERNPALEGTEGEWTIKKEGQQLSRDQHNELYAVLDEYGALLDREAYHEMT